MNAILAPDSAPSSRLQSIALQGCGIAAVFAVFSLPIVAFAVSAALLINLSRNTPDVARRLLGLMLVIAVSMMISSRAVSIEGSDDFVGYYELYKEIQAGDYSRMFQFGGGLEVTLPALFYLWSLLLPELSINGLMLSSALTSAILFWVWVDLNFYRKGGERIAPALIGAALLLFNLYFSTQTTRQFLSMIVLLYAFSAHTTIRRWLFITLAASIHLTALPFYGAYWLATRGRYGVVLLLSGVVLIRFYFPALLTLLDVLPEALVEKLAYYVDNNSEYTDSDLGALKLIGLLCLLSLLSLAAQGFRLDARTRPWHSVPWIAAVVHVLLLPIPLAPLRSTLAVHSVVTGLVAHRMFSRRNRILLQLVLNILLLYKLAGYATLEDGSGLTSTMTVLMNAVL